MDVRGETQFDLSTVREDLLGSLLNCSIAITRVSQAQRFREGIHFGKAFKDAGFKFPKEDETFLKVPPVLPGAPAQKGRPGRMFGMLDKFT